MSFRVEKTTKQEISSSLDSSHSCEQLPEAYWPEPGWWEGPGGSSCQEWQTIAADERYYAGNYEEVPVSSVVEEVELDVDQLEQSMSDNLWMMAATDATVIQPLCPAQPQRLCDQPVDEEPVESSVMSPVTYDLQLDEVNDLPPLQHNNEQHYVIEMTGGGAMDSLDNIEPLSGSWIDTTSYIDQMTSLEDFTETVTTGATSHDTNDQLHTDVKPSQPFSVDQACPYAESNNLLYSPDVTVGAATLNDEEASAEEIMAELCRAVSPQAGQPKLQLEQLLSQMFGQNLEVQGSNPSWEELVENVNEEIFTSSVDDGYLLDIGSSVDAGCFLEVGSTVDMKCLDSGSNIEAEALWNIDSGYQTASTTPTTGDESLSPSGPEFNSHSSLQASKGVFESVLYSRKRPASLAQSNDSESDDDDNFSLDDDDDDDDFMPTTYQSKLSVARRRQKKSSSGRGKRKRREEYALLSMEERRDRKREQNKNAATKYRERRRQEELEREEACDELEEKNNELRREVADKEREVKVLRRLVVNIFRQPGAAASTNQLQTAMSAGLSSCSIDKNGKRNARRELLIKELLKSS